MTRPGPTAARLTAPAGSPANGAGQTPGAEGLQEIALQGRVSDRLALTAIFWVGAVRLGLWLLPLAKVRRLTAWGSRAWLPPHRPRAPDPQGVGRTIEASRRAVPHATCLVLALAAQGLLARRGGHSTVHLGGTRTADGTFRAHAWVESKGKVIVGQGPSGHEPIGTLALTERQP